MSDGAAKVETRIECDGWRALDCSALTERCFASVEAAQPGARWPVCVLFTDDKAVAELNRHFRGKDRATNVLSFPPGEAPWPDHDYLGDIALAFETCRVEASEKRISLHDHAAHLIVHGMLHLIGYDHQTDEEADAMERREAAILETLGVADPYAPPERKA